MLLLQNQSTKFSPYWKPNSRTGWKQKGKELEAKQKLELQAEKFKFEGNQKQFIFNTEIEDLVAKIKEANTAKNYKKIAHLAEQAESLLHKRQKLFCGICVFTLRSFPMIFVFSPFGALYFFVYWLPVSCQPTWTLLSLLFR